jgi:hypothetical protein
MLNDDVIAFDLGQSVLDHDRPGTLSGPRCRM